jgi:hypothetical protein
MTHKYYLIRTVGGGEGLERSWWELWAVDCQLACMLLRPPSGLKDRFWPTVSHRGLLFVKVFFIFTKYSRKIYHVCLARGLVAHQARC